MASALPLLGSAKCDFVLAAGLDDPCRDLNESVLYDDARLDIRETYLDNLRQKGLYVKNPILSSDGAVQFWCVSAPNIEVLYDVAEELHEQLPTMKNDVYHKPFFCRTRGTWTRFKNWLNKVDPFKLECEHYDFSKQPRYFSSRFDKKRMSIFLNHQNPKLMFPQSLRSKLVFHILEHTKYTHNEPENRDEDTTTAAAGTNHNQQSAHSNHMGISHLITTGVFTAAYPCHEEPLNQNLDEQIPTNDRQVLSLRWASFKCMFNYQPIELVKKYFGVRIAFYFKWLGFYNMCLIPASIVGVLCFLYGVFSTIDDENIDALCAKSGERVIMCPLCDKFCPYYSLNGDDFTCLYARITHIFDNNATPFFAVFMSFWSIIYLELWKRHESLCIYNWHIMGYVDNEVVRPEYAMSARKSIRNPITGKLEPVSSRTVHAIKMAGTFSVVFFFIFLVIASVVGIVVFRAAMFSVSSLHDKEENLGATSDYSKIFVTVMGATLNLIVINVLKFGYQRLAFVMTVWENPRTQSNFENSFTVKLFWFQFVNTYASLFYVAFFKSEFFTGWPSNYKRIKNLRLEGCSDQGCFLELFIQIIIIMAGQQFLGNFVEIVWPYLQRKYNVWKRKLHSTLPVPIWESDYCLEDRSLLSLVWEYQEVVIQYGFVTLFVAAFPLAPLLALLTNIIEIRIDAINMVNSFRRPVASISQGIGIWYEILATVTALSVLVNGFVLSFASEFIPRLVYKYQFSEDGSMKGYIGWSLTQFNVSDFKDFENPKFTGGFKNVTHCWFHGHHHSQYPYDYNTTHYKILSLRLLFAFIFQWIVTAATRAVAWVIPDCPKEIDLSIKREAYLNREALRVHKVHVKSTVVPGEDEGEEGE